MPVLSYKMLLTMTLGLGVYLLSSLIKVPPFRVCPYRSFEFSVSLYPSACFTQEQVLSCQQKQTSSAKSKCILSLEMMLFITLLLFKNEYYLQNFFNRVAPLCLFKKNFHSFITRSRVSSVAPSDCLQSSNHPTIDKSSKLCRLLTHRLELFNKNYFS